MIPWHRLLAFLLPKRGHGIFLPIEAAAIIIVTLLSQCVTKVVIFIILLLLCVICVFLCHRLLSFLCLLFNVRYDLRACCAHEDETGTDESAQVLTRKN